MVDGIPSREDHLVVPGDARLVGEVLDLGVSPYLDRIEDGAILTDCRLRLWNPNGVIIHTATFDHCIIEAMVDAEDADWTPCHLTDCRFLGTFRGCCFGAARLGRETTGSIRGCDFSQATLHLCEFRRVAVESLTFPRWPCVTILDPSANREAWRSLQLSGFFRVLQKVIGNAAPDLAAIHLHWPTVAQEFLVREPTDEVQSMFAGLPFVRF